MTKRCEKQANKGRKKIVFGQGDFVWVHLRKDRFPDQRKSKLQPRANGPFKVLHKINDNAYKIVLPSSYDISTSFNVIDLSPFFGFEESRTTPFQEGEDDDPDAFVTPDASLITPNPPLVTHQKSSTQSVTQDQALDAQVQVNEGPATRSRAKKLQHEVHASSLSYVVILMRVIYYLSRVLYFNPGLHKRPLRRVT
jgi:hypothetical protein